MPLTKKQKTRRKLKTKQHRQGEEITFVALSREAKQQRRGWYVVRESPRGGTKPSGSIYAY